MKISIHAEDKDLTIPIPNWMIDSALTRTLIAMGIENMPQFAKIDQKMLHAFLKEFTKTAKEYKGLELVHVESANGKVVSIVL